MSPLSYRHWIFFGTLCLLLTGCGGGGSSPDSGPGPIDTTGQIPAVVTSLMTNMTVMASVTDADGEPIAGALVGGSETTGSDGIVMGAPLPEASGWYSISASGYAQEYVKPSGSFQGKTTFAVRLTPVDVLYSWTLTATKPVTLTVGDVLAPDLSVEFGTSAFSSDVTLSVTVLDPVKTHTTLAALDTPDTLYITHPFEIRAQDNAGQDQQMAVGQTAQVTIADNGDMGVTPRLFWFDPDAGIWKEQTDAACVRSDATHVQCQISHFSQHGGASDTPPASNPPSDPDSASRDSDQAQKDWEDTGDTSGGLPDSLLDALTAEMNAVIAWADAHASEAAKTLIINTIGRLQSLAYDDYQYVDGSGNERSTDELYTAIEKVMVKLADPHLKDPQCINFEKILHLTAQAQLLGYYTDDGDGLADELGYVLQQLVETCNVIQGRVEYSIVLASDKGWPSWGPYSAEPRESGASYWTEYHDINLVIHVNNIEGGGQEVLLDGSDKVETDFPLVVYRREVNDNGSCSFDTFERNSYWGESNPGQVEVTVHAQADNAGLQYSNEVLSAASAINIQAKFFDVGWAFNDSFACVTAPDDVVTAALWENYQGQLMAQYSFLETADGNPFYNWTGEQLISLWEILDQEPDVTRPGTEDTYPTRIWRGSEILLEMINIPAGERGHKVIMRWDIQHIDYTRGKWVSFHQ